ncbi:HNH endonuclease [Streptomyces microflavus]|uniref:HNH endonuclease n=1 Tax=Streptomyces microflavus TaxID=1919 RepID=UPI0036A660D5
MSLSTSFPRARDCPGGRGCRSCPHPTHPRKRREDAQPTSPLTQRQRCAVPAPSRGDPYAIRIDSRFESGGGHTMTNTTRGTHMRCIDCTEPATHRGRCKTHHATYEGRPNVRSRRARGRRRANRRDGAARLRRRVQERGSAWCDWCLGDFPADGVDVDHVRPLALRGEDTDSNVQVLCHGCHRVKTGEDFSGGVSPTS